MAEKTKIIQNTAMNLGFLTNRVGRLLAIELKNRLGKEKFDLPSHCLGILAELWEQDGIIQQDLAISIVKDKATIARALELMEKKNMTYKGNELQNQIMFHGAGLLGDAKKDISAEEMEICLRTLEKIYNNLKDKL